MPGGGLFALASTACACQNYSLIMHARTPDLSWVVEDGNRQQQTGRAGGFPADNIAPELLKTG